MQTWLEKDMKKERGEGRRDQEWRVNSRWIKIEGEREGLNEGSMENTTVN